MSGNALGVKAWADRARKAETASVLAAQQWAERIAELEKEKAEVREHYEKKLEEKDDLIQKLENSVECEKFLREGAQEDEKKLRAKLEAMEKEKETYSEMLFLHKLLEIRDQVLAGTHPRIKLPQHVIDEFVANMSSKCESDLSYSHVHILDLRTRHH